MPILAFMLLGLICIAFAAVLAAADAAISNVSHHEISDAAEDGTRGVSQWTFRATNPDGTRTEVQGVDLFRIRDGRLVEKQAIRKQRPAIPAK